MADQMLDPAIIAERLGKAPAQAVEGDAASDAVALRAWAELFFIPSTRALLTRAAERAEREAVDEDAFRTAVAFVRKHALMGNEHAKGALRIIEGGLPAEREAGKTMADLFATIDRIGPVFDDADAAEAARMRPSPWQACDAGEERRCGRFRLVVWQSAWQSGSRFAWSVSDAERGGGHVCNGTAPSLDAAKRAAESVGGWDR